MTEKDTTEKNKKPRGASREELQAIQKELQNTRDFVESSILRMEETVTAIRTQVQQILSYLPVQRENKAEQRQKFR